MVGVTGVVSASALGSALFSLLLPWDKESIAGSSVHAVEDEMPDRRGREDHSGMQPEDVGANGRDRRVKDHRPIALPPGLILNQVPAS